MMHSWLAVAVGCAAALAAAPGFAAEPAPAFPARADVTPDAEMAARSVLSPGNTARLVKLFDRAKRGEELTIAVIGGSITQGARATTPENRYGNRIAAWWRKQFPQSHFTFVNAGIGATGSAYGALRASRDLLNHHPDFVVIEFAVNDPNDRDAAESLEGLVRQVLTQPQQPAVMLLFMMNRLGSNSQEWFSKVGLHYELPMISYRDGIWPEIASGRMKVDSVVADDVHPNDRGHAYTAEFVTRYLERILALNLPVEAIPPLPAPLFSDVYQHVRLYEARDLKPTVNQGWTLDPTGQFWKADTPGSVLECSVEGSLVDVLFWRIKGPMGRASVQVDDRPPVILDGWFAATWGGYTPITTVARDLAPGKHHVRIELLDDKAALSTGHEFRIYAIGTGGLPVQP